jgi:hypothetical protein
LECDFATGIRKRGLADAFGSGTGRGTCESILSPASCLFERLRARVRA